MNKLSFTINPMPKARQEPAGCVIGGHASFYKKASQRDYEKQLMIELEKYRPEKPMTGAIVFKLDVYLPMPKLKGAWWEEAALMGIIRPACYPDWDNLAKIVCDRMQKKNFFVNDSHIVSATVNKIYSENPRWEIELIEYPQPRTKKEYKAMNNET